MIESTCHCCGAVLPEADGISLRRCAACGAPQVRLAAELRARSVEERERYEQDLASGTASSRTQSAAGQRLPAEVQWRQAIGLAAIASAATVLLCALLPPLAVAAWWVPAAVLLVYRLRFPRTVVTPLFGARVGAVVGVFCSVGGAAVATVWLAVRRYALHRMNGFDALYSGTLAAAEKQAVAQNGEGVAASFGVLRAPEFRAGMLLLLGLLVAGAFVLLCVMCGAISAAARRWHLANSAE